MADKPRGISGNNGYVVLGSCTIQELTQWEMTFSKNLQSYASVSSAGWNKRVIGNKEITGTITGKYDNSDPINAHIDTDSTASLELHLDTNDYWSGDAFLGEVTYSANVDSGEVEEWTANFSSDGTWTFTNS